MTKRIAFITSIESFIIPNTHFFKDICLVPILLGEYLGHEVTIVASDIDEVALHGYFPDVHVHKIAYSAGYMEDMRQYVVANAAEIDLLYLFGPYASYVPIIMAYKSLNPNGKIYMKLDVNGGWLGRMIYGFTFNYMLKNCDLITSECEIIKDKINLITGASVQQMQNGYYDYFPAEPVSYEEKKNIIVAVGRLDAPEKQIMYAINAFLAAKLDGWEFRLVGGMSDEFRELVEKHIAPHPFGKNITLVGPVYDKRRLEAEYRQAKVFSLTSAVECHAHVFAEAAKYGCYIVSTNVDGAADITKNEKWGKIVPTNDVFALAVAFNHLPLYEEKIKKTCEEQQAYAREHLNWRALVKKLANYLEEVGYER